jgi:hypothetical protein
MPEKLSGFYFYCSKKLGKEKKPDLDLVSYA